MAESVAALFDREVASESALLEQMTRSVTILDDVFDSMVSAPSERELIHRACSGAARLCDADTAVLSTVSGDTATVVNASGWAGMGRFALGEKTIEVDALSVGGVAVQFEKCQTASITSVIPDRPWSVAAVSVDGKNIGLLHVAAVLPPTLRDAFGAYAATLGGCIERSGLRVKRIRQEQVLYDSVRSWADGAEFSIGMASGSPGAEAKHEAVATGSVMHPSEPLTDREAEVLSAVLTGASNAAIATELVITVDTVKSHMKKILRKFGAANRAELIARHG
ncbi:helix-turn-helix domain-containing protein [Rhodococcoides kyotonense]|uniref:helix-turn-helix domain-containing protein n=1 Tax=Rhodococcoides kyotonense TaxID=398843 RepID=UPI00159594C3|nr:helix-turn-helix transcriptional regulator [Rhodococcus kyotonensis]